MGEVFADDVTTATTIDRLVHHAEAILLKTDSYRLKTATSVALHPPAQLTGPRLVVQSV